LLSKVGFLHLPLSNQSQHAQQIASDVAALHTLQPYNHAEPKQPYKIASLGTCAGAAPQATGGGVCTMKQPCHHDRVQTQHQTGHELFDMLAPMHNCDACRCKLHRASCMHHHQRSAPVNMHAAKAANHA
jgi:hypothetical protein